MEGVCVGGTGIDQAWSMAVMKERTGIDQTRSMAVIERGQAIENRNIPKVQYRIFETM